MLGQMTDNWPRELCMKLGVKSSVFWFSAACQGQGKELQECSSVTEGLLASVMFLFSCCKISLTSVQLAVGDEAPASPAPQRPSLLLPPTHTYRERV